MSREERRDWVARDAAVVWHGFTQMSCWAENAPVIVERAEGRELIDVDGRRYLDAISSLWVITLGHRVPELDQALQEQLARVAHSTLLGNGNRVVIELAEALARRVPVDAPHFVFASDGASAVVVMSATKAKELGVKPLAKVAATAVVGVDPTMMLHGPIPATRKVLVASLVGSVAAITVLAAMTQQRMHEVTTLQLDATTEAAASLRSAADPGGAVVVSTRGEFGRFAWDQVLDHRYLGVPDPDDMLDVTASLVAAEVPDLVLAGPPDEVAEHVVALHDGGFETVSTHPVPDAGWEVLVLSRTG